MNHATLREGYDFDLVTKGLAKAVRFKEWVFGSDDTAEPADTSAKIANASDDTKRWLASIVGAFDNDPLYPQILENERQARLMDDEQFIILE